MLFYPLNFHLRGKYTQLCNSTSILFVDRTVFFDMSSGQKATRLRETVVVLIILLLVGGLALAPGITVSQDQPPLPASYFGEVTVDGEPAEDGVEVTAKIDGEERGSIQVEEGSYGGPGTLEEKLTVDGEDGDNVEFFVESEPADTDPDSVEYESGVNKEVNLSVGEIPDDVDEVASVSGEVTDFEDDLVDDGTIELFDDDSSLATDDLSDGSYEFDALDPGAYTLEVTDVTDNEDAEVDVDLDAGEDAVENIQLDQEEVEDDDDTTGTGTGTGTTDDDDAEDDDEADDEVDDEAEDPDVVDDEQPITVEDVSETVDATEPDNSVRVETDVDADTAPDEDGVTMDTSEDLETVVDFTVDEEVASTDIDEYRDQGVRDTAAQSVQDQISEELADDDTNEITVSASSVARITTDDVAGDDGLSSVRMTADADDVDDPEQTGIFREADDSWEELETDVVDETDERIVFEAETDGNSLFTVADVNAEEDDDDEDPDEPDETDEFIPGFGVVVAVIAMITTAILSRYSLK